MVIPIYRVNCSPCILLYTRVNIIMSVFKYAALIKLKAMHSYVPNLHRGQLNS